MRLWGAGAIQGTMMNEDEKKTPAKNKTPNRDFKAGMAVGIGSAAIVAALLYARSGKPKKK
jgi:hypothetical protein